jgi:hypothetical protein
MSLPSKSDRPIGGNCRIPLDNAALDADRALYGINCTGELDKRPIAHQLDHAAAIFGEGGIDKCGAQFFQRSQRASLVFGHETSVTNHVGRHDGC